MPKREVILHRIEIRKDGKTGELWLGARFDWRPGRAKKVLPFLHLERVRCVDEERQVSPV
jgi:hypothetical protein